MAVQVSREEVSREEVGYLTVQVSREKVGYLTVQVSREKRVAGLRAELSDARARTRR
jgi:hypothetical protein